MRFIFGRHSRIAAMTESARETFRVFAVVECVERRRSAVPMHRLDVRMAFQTAFEWSCSRLRLLGSRRRVAFRVTSGINHKGTKTQTEN